MDVTSIASVSFSVPVPVPVPVPDEMFSAGRVRGSMITPWSSFDARIADGSAKEVDSDLSLLVETAVVDRRRAETALDLFGETRALSWPLLHPDPIP